MSDEEEHEAEAEAADLSLVATEQLIGELFVRHDGIVIARERTLTSDASEWTVDYSGGLSRAMGLAVRAQHRLAEIARGQ